LKIQGGSIPERKNIIGENNIFIIIPVFLF